VTPNTSADFRPQRRLPVSPLGWSIEVRVASLTPRTEPTPQLKHSSRSIAKSSRLYATRVHLDQGELISACSKAPTQSKSADSRLTGRTKSRRRSRPRPFQQP